MKNTWNKYPNKGGKQKTAKYYAANQKVLREYARKKYRNLSEKEKNKIGINNFYSIITNEQTLKFGDIVVNNREFHASKQAIVLNLVNTNKIVVSDKFKHSDDGSKYFIGYLHDDDVIKYVI